METGLLAAADELEALRGALAEACDAIVEVGGSYALRVRLVEPNLLRWRCMANPLLCPEDADA